MNSLVEELKHQYHSTLKMYQSILETCPEEIWSKSFIGVPFWREAYHALFWIYTFLGPKNKGFHPHPFGKDIDPRLFTPPNNTCEHAEAIQYAEHTVSYIDEVFETMSSDELGEKDDVGESHFRSVYHRLMYGLRHGQHHIGKLTAYLNLEGIQLDHWSG